jgi:phosphoglycerate dehydrogenase-like enzyme
MEAQEAGAARTLSPGLSFAFGTLDVTELFAPEDIQKLGELCAITDMAPLRRFDDARGTDLLSRTEILVTGWGCPHIDQVVLEAAPHLKLIAHAAGSVKALLSPAVFEHGIEVVTAADANALPVAEFTLAAILFANKRVLEFSSTYRRERRSRRLYETAHPNVGNWKKTIGIIGASRIGRRVIELLKPFDFRVLLHDPYVDAAAARALGVEGVELDHLLALSDVVSLHAPELAETRHMLDARRLALLRDGAIFINTARGALVEQAALERELKPGRISAVLDVTDPDVLPEFSPLYKFTNVLLTPHIAGALGSERQRFGQLVTNEIERFIRGDALRHAVDPVNFARQA